MHFDARVQIDLPHRVRFTRDAFAPDNSTLRDVFAENPWGQRAKLLVVVDQGLVAARPTLQNQIQRYFEESSKHSPEIVGFRALPGGEQIKNDLSLLEALLGDLHRLGIDRRSTVLALGGGALLDTVGFAAAMTHRGVRLVRMPSTTLAQTDSGVGVKNGVNMFGQKNFIGTFAVPWAVVNDLSLLDTLSDRDWRCGLAEAVKVALLKDTELYHTIQRSAADLTQRDAAVGDEVWKRSAKLHLHHITAPVSAGGGGDPFESAAARPLDFGHWAAHKLEALTDYELRHGEAVALGLALDTTYAALAGLLPDPVARRVRGTLSSLGFQLSHPALNDPALLGGLDEFRQHLGGRLTITLIRDVARPIEVHEIDRVLMKHAAQQLLSVAAPVA
ncbi:MAG: 3-dehydroquinate synthase [Planctomycetota bacterium]